MYSPHHHHWHYPPTQVTPVLSLKTGIRHHAFCIAVPVTITCQPCRERHQRILYASGDGSLRTHMLHQQQLATWLQDAPDFSQATCWIGDGAKDKRCDRAIKGRISKR